MRAITTSYRLQLERALCASSLRCFVEAAWPIVVPGTAFVPGWHLDAICLHLEAVWPQRRIRNLLINIPPRHAKSLIVDVFWPAWLWTLEPHLRFLSASYAAGLATRDSVKCRRLVESPWYRERWPNVRMLDDQNQKTRFDLAAGGYRLATSVGAATTGEGGHIRILDDPHNVLEAHSPIKRARAVLWHDEAWSSRTDGDPAQAASVVVMQRVHEKDLSAHLLAQGGWEHLCMPAEYEGPRAPTSIGWTDPRRTPGELLWPGFFTPDVMRDLKKRLGSYGEAGQLQQRPAPLQGGMLDRSWWKRWTVLPKFRMLVSSWDLSNSEVPAEGSSFVVGQLWGVAGADRYLVDQVRARMSPLTTENAIRDTNVKWAAAHGQLAAWLIEKKAAGPGVIERLRKVLSGITPITPIGSKEERVAAISPQVEAGNVWIPSSAPWVSDFVEECAAFPRGANDDQVDTATQALSWIDRVGARGVARYAPDIGLRTG